MKQLGSKMVRRLPPVVSRDRRIKELEIEARRSAGKIRWNEDQRTRLEDRLNRALRRVETFRERSELSEREKRDALRARDRKAQELQEKIERLEADLRRSRSRLDKPSFLTLLVAYRELYEQRFAADPSDALPLWQMPFKLRNYSLAQSHGVGVPEVYQVWEHPEDINLSSLTTDKMVLKSDGGHSGHGVFILQRTAQGWETLDGGIAFQGNTPSAEILERFSHWHGPYFAEELLEGTSDSAIPEDIKVYTAYGEVLQILLMQAGGEGSMDRRSYTRRYLGADGEDLGKVAEMGTWNPEIPTPENIDHITETARHLSRAVGMPFVRVDLYQTPRGLILGELTPTPGGRQRYRGEHDAYMGLEWVKAQSRLEQDLAAGRPYGSLFGRNDYTWWYDQLTQSGKEAPALWSRPRRTSQQWC